MATGNAWLGKIKSRAKLVQETAKNRLDKISETLDKKIKEAQEDLDKQRSSEAPASAVPKIQRWRPSAENPDGEIVAEVKPPPIEQPVVQPPPPETLEASEPPAPVEEVITIARRSKDKRRSTKKSESKENSIKQNDNQEEITPSLNNTSQQITDEEVVHKPSNDLVENTTVIAISQKEEFIPKQDSPTNIDVEKKESVSSKSEPDQDIIQTNASTSSTPINNVPLNLSTPEDTSIDIPADEQPVSTDIDNSANERFGAEKIPMDEPADEHPALTSIDNSSAVHFQPKDTLVDKPSDEQPASTNTDDLTIVPSDLENSSVNETTNEQPSSTNSDDLPIEHSGPNENITTNTSDGELLTSTNIDDSAKVHSDAENIAPDISDDEIPTSTITADKLDEHPEPENITTNIDDSTNVHSDAENMSPDTSDVEIPTSTIIADKLDEHPESENMQVEIPDDKIPTLPNVVDLPVVDSHVEIIRQDTPDDELTASTKSDTSSVEHADSENINLEIPDDEPFTLANIEQTPKTHRDLENIPQDIPNEELSASTKSDELAVEQSDLENIELQVPNNEQSALTDVDDSSKAHSDSENFPQDIPNDELPVEQSGLQNIQTEILENTSSKLTDNTDLASVDSDQENIPHDILNDELLASTKSNNSSSEDSALDDQQPTVTNIDDSPTSLSDSENILKNIPDDKLPSLLNVDNISNEELDSVNILMDIPDDELPAVENIAESSMINSSSANNQIKIPHDQSTILSNIDNLPDPLSDSDNILMNIPDDALPTIEDIVDLPVVNSSTENMLMNIPDDELPTLPNISNSFTVDSAPKSSPTKTTHEKSPVSTKVAEKPIAHSTLENVSTNKSNNKEVSTPPNELEDSFEELRPSNIPVHRAPEKPPQESTHLAALRAMLSKLQDDDDEDEEFLSSKQGTNILAKNVNTAPKQLTTLNIVKNNLSSSSSSLSDGTAEDLFSDPPPPNNTLSDEPSTEKINETISTMSIETKSVETKRFSVVNSHSIPPGIKIQQINCSSTYIYLCTTDRKIFYAKLNSNNLEDPLQWQQHTDLAEQLVVSVSNRTVWRLHNKILYTANDPIQHPPIGSQWSRIKIDNGQSLLSMSINDQCGWYIKEDGTLSLLRTDDKSCESIDVACPFNLSTVFCFSEKVGVATSDGEILIRAGCTLDVPEGGGWIFIEHNFGPINDFALLASKDTITIVDKKHHLWLHSWSSDKGFYEILCDDDFHPTSKQSLVSVNSELLCFTDCEKQIRIFSDCLTGVQWTVVEKNTRLQRLIGAFSNEDYVWALTTDRRIISSNGKVLEKPRQAQYLTHATFVPNNSSQNTILWSLDESCGIYVRPNIENGTEWEQANQVQFEWNRRLVDIVCSNEGVWAVDDQGFVHFRHGHISASQNVGSYGTSFLPPAWITIPGEPRRHRSFAQVYCGPAAWMVYATDNKQNVYTRVGINEENPVGTSWKVIEDCSALELAISEHTLWLLTSFGEIQCRENISLANPIGTRSTTLSGFFLSLTVSMDDSQVWALDSQRNLLKLDRLTVLFEK